MDKFASRKFILAGAAFLASSIFLATGLCTADQWFSGVTWLMALYFGADVAQVGLARTPLNAAVAEMRDATLRMETATQHAAVQAELAQSALSSVTFSRSGDRL